MEVMARPKIEPLARDGLIHRFQVMGRAGTVRTPYITGKALLVVEEDREGTTMDATLV